MNDIRQSTDQFSPKVVSGVAPASSTRSTILTPERSVAEVEPSLGDLVMGLTDDLMSLVRKEVDLAKVELQENLQEGAQAGGKVAAGGMVAYAGLLFILAAVTIALGQWWENMWLAAAVVGLVTAIIGWVMLNGGLNQLKQVSLVPHKAMASLERDAKMAKEKLS